MVWVVLTLGNGSPDETISAALYRMELQGKLAGKLFRPIVDLLFWFDEEHCYHAWKSEINKAQLPKVYQ